MLRMGYVRQSTEQITYDQLAPLLREGLQAGELDRLAAQGAALTPQAAIALALEEAASEL
jgi:hypothetical protein